jgi:serine/threonine protein phosphatase 1
MPTYAIGDIHGWREPLDELLATLRPRLGGDDTVVFLGDYIDRGDDVKGCIDAVLHFRDTVPARVECLIGNHEEWLLNSMRDPHAHSWLLGMDGFATIRSYSAEAERALRAAACVDRGAVYAGTTALPYELFFDALPATHREFLEGLARYCQTPDCVCAHAGVHPSISDLDHQGRVLTCGHDAFPDDYRGDAIVVYGHHNDPDVGADGWPRPRRVGNTIGIDTISHGVLTAVALPSGEVIQSARYDHAVRRGN